MATFTQTTKNGQDLITTLSQGEFIDVFDYTIAESPDVTQGVVFPYGDDVLNTLSAFGYIDYDEMASDRLDWWETGRVNKAYKGTITKLGSALTFPAVHDIRVGDVIEVTDNTTREQANVTAVVGTAITVQWKTAAPAVADGAVSAIHITREVKKGSEGSTEWLHRDYEQFTNQPIIVRDGLKYTRSDLAQKVQFLGGDSALWTLDYADVETRFQNAQTAAFLYGRASETASAAQVAGLDGMTSLEEAVNDRGNNIDGGLSTMADIEAYTRMLTANKSPMNNMLLLDLEYIQLLEQGLGKVNQYDSSGFNFGTFANQGSKMLDLGFDGFKKDGFTVAYKKLDILDDDMYYGSFVTGVKPHGFSMPVGTTPDGKGGNIPYISMVYRNNGRRVLGRDGMVFNQGLSDSASIDLVSEFTGRYASMKDFSAFS